MTRRTGLIAVAAVTACLLSACGSNGSDGGSKPSTSATSSSPAARTTVTFDGVTVVGANDLSAKPTVTSTSSSTPTKLAIKDLVTGTGAPASPTAKVDVQYVGVLYANGKAFDASWDHGGVVNFPLQTVVAGFTQGIGGTTGVPAMKSGGRRLMILPPALGYGSTGTPDGSVPPDAAIVFVVDLVDVS